MKNKKSAIALVVAASILIGVVFAGLWFQTEVANVGRIKGIGISVDPSVVDWGDFVEYEASNKTVEFNVTNIKNVPVTVNFTDDCSSGLSLVKPNNFTLVANTWILKNATLCYDGLQGFGDFSFTIWVLAEEY